MSKYVRITTTNRGLHQLLTVDFEIPDNLADVYRAHPVTAAEFVVYDKKNVAGFDIPVPESGLTKFDIGGG